MAIPSNTPDPSQDASNTPVAAPDQTANAAPDNTQAPQAPQTQPQFAQGPSAPNQPSQAQPGQPATASNAPAPAPVHPSIARASRLADVAEALGGGPRYSTTIDPVSGATTRTKVPASKSNIAMSIVLEALSGGLAGLGARGTNATGQAAAAGLNQGEQIAEQRKQAQQQKDQQAQQDAKNRADAVVRQANAYEQNSRTILNTSQAERYGVDSLKDSVSQNSQLLSDYDDQGAVLQKNVSQDALQAGMKDGTFNATREIALPDGFTNINGRYEQTFSVIANPSAKIPLTNEQARAYGDAGVQGFLPYKDGKTSVADGVTVPGYVIARANAQMQANNLMKQDVAGVTSALANSSDKANQELAKTIPDFQSLMNDPERGAGLQSALGRFQKYVSHSDQHGMDFYESLQQMAQPSKLNPQTKQTVPNNDAPFAQTIFGAFGNGDPARGKAILQAYHDEVTPTPIKNADEANSILADHTSTPQEIKAATTFIRNSQNQKIQVASAEAAARKEAGATGDDTIATLGEALAKGSLTEDQVPNFAKIKPEVQSYLSQHHPNLDQNSIFLTGAERNRRDLAGVATTNLDIIQSTLKQRPDLLGVIQGRISQGKELTGTNDTALSAVAQALDNYTNASVGAHNMRSASARADAKTALLNGFKNGPEATNAAINASRTSLAELANTGKPKGVNGQPYIVTPRPSTPGQLIDAGTVQNYIKKYGTPQAARAAAQKDGWALPHNGSK